MLKRYSPKWISMLPSTILFTFRTSNIIEFTVIVLLHSIRFEQFPYTVSSIEMRCWVKCFPEAPHPEASMRFFDPLRSDFMVASIYSQFGRSKMAENCQAQQWPCWTTLSSNAKFKESIYLCFYKRTQEKTKLDSFMVWFARFNIDEN